MMSIKTLLQDIEEYKTTSCGTYDEAGEAEELLERCYQILYKESATTISKESTPKQGEAVSKREKALQRVIEYAESLPW